MAEVKTETPLEAYKRKMAELQGRTIPSYTYQPTAVEEPKQQNQGGILGGIGYTAEELGLGFVRGIEGVSDFLVGGVADLLGNDDLADEIMKNDWVNYNHANEWYNPSGAMETVGSISSGVGAMLPSIIVAAAITYFSGGSAAPAASSLVAKAAGTAMTMASAAGQATSQAAKQSGTAGGKEWAYGAGTGIQEGVIEGITAGIGGSKTGKILGKSLGKTTAGKLAVTFAGEAVEEMMSEGVDVGLKRVTGVDPNATTSIEELLKTGFIGGSVGGIIGGGSTAVSVAQAGGINNYQASQNVQNLTAQVTENNVRQAEGKTALYKEKSITETAKKLSKNLQKMDVRTRKAYLDSNPFMRSYFAEDGTLLSETGSSAIQPPKEVSSTYSASLRGREYTLAYAPSQTATATSKEAMNTIAVLTKGNSEVVLTDHDFGTTADGHKINGEYRNGIIYLSANATSQEKINFVAKHEMAHTLEGTREYGILGEYIQEALAKDSALAKKYDISKYAMAYANSQNSDLMAETKAYEATTEMYADFIANEILSSQESVNRLAKRDANIVKKFLTWVRDTIKSLGMSKEDRAAYRELRKMEKMLGKALDASKGGVALADIDTMVRERYYEGDLAEESAKSTPAPQGELATARYSLSSMGEQWFEGKDVTIEDYESRSYKMSEAYKKYVEECVANMIDSGQITESEEAQARKQIEKTIDGIVDVAVAMKKAGYDILDYGEHRKKRDTKKRLLFSSLEPNSDYLTSHDISTICDKRKNFADIYDEIVRREEKMGVPKGKRFFDNVDNYFVLHDILASKGLTAACKQCYVESMRKNLAPMANAFLELMQEKDANNKKNKQLWDKKGNPKVGNTELREKLLNALAKEQYEITVDDLTVEMLTTAKGLLNLKIKAPLIYETFNSFYGQSKPKMPRQAVPFRFGELSAMLRNHNGTINQRLVKQINSTGGFRLQSYSDFQIENWADVLQVIFEAGTLGLNGHAYTKVPAFLDATEGTNLKRNISVFMYKDSEVNGVDKWRIDKKDSFPAELNDIYNNIVKKDASGNTGIIAVSQNADMSAWIMANDMIAYGIPFHKSGIKMDTVRKNTVRDGKRIIEGYRGIIDHTRQQSEVWKTTEGDHKAFTRVKKAINIYDWWDFANTENLSQKELIEKNLKRYIDECDEAGYYPKFRDYVMDNEGIINKIVAYSKAFGDANATVDTVSFEYKGYRIPYGYYKFLGDFSMFKPNGKASPQEVLSLSKYNFKKAVEYFAKPAELRREEVLQQFDNETVREDYRKSNLTAEQLEEIVKQKRKDVVDEVIDKRYGKKDAESRKSIDLDDISDFDAITFSKWFDELTIEELQELIGEDSKTEVAKIESLPTKEERRAAYIERMYKQGNLNEAITKIVKRHPQMQAYFKNTKVNQKYNPLYKTKGDEYIVMFHGTPTKFNVFDTKKIGKHGTVMGSGLYFTESLRYAEDYKTDDGRVMATLLNIEKPLSRSKITMTKEDLKRFIREVVDTNGEDYLSNYGDVYSLGYEKLLDKTVNKLYDYHTNDADMIEDIYVTSRMDFDEFHNDLTDLLGYDGIIAWNKAEGTQAVAFRSNQAKDIFNFKPTKSDDVRYSVYTQRDPSTVTQKEYEHHYWAFANKVLSKSEWGVVNNAISDIKLQKKYPQTADGIYMIPTGEYKGSATVYNKIVFTDGIHEAPSIEMVIEIDSSDENFLKEMREVIYGYGNAGLSFKNSEIVKVHTSEAYGYDNFVQNGQRSIQNNAFGGTNKNGNGIVGETEGDRRLSVDVANVESVMTPDEKLTLKEKAAIVKKNAGTAWVKGQIESTNVQAGIEHEAKRLGGNIEAKVHRARTARAAAVNMLTMEQRDFSGIHKVGDSLSNIFKPIFAQGEKYATEFNTYLYHMHNVDRMSFEDTAKAEINKLLQTDAELAKIVARKNIGEKSRERLLKKTENGKRYLELLEVKNKPVFGESVTADESRKVIQEIEKAHPEFKAVAEKVWAYSRNLIQYRVDAGLITQELADRLLTMYPHYVPTYRAEQNIAKSGIARLTKGVEVNRTIRTAKGSSDDLADISVAMSYQTLEVVRAAAINSVATELHDLAEAKQDYTNIILAEEPVEVLEDIDYGEDMPKGEVVFYKDGKRYVMAVADTIATGFESFSSYNNDGPLVSAIAKSNDLFKKLVTSANPLFLVRNMVRDVQEALFYTHYGMGNFIKTMPRAMKIMAKKGDLWQRYLAVGGLQSGYFSRETGIYDKRSKARKGFSKVMDKLAYANEFVEQIPRFTEFILAMESGKTVQQALLESADVTTNFSRGGKLGKTLNRTVMPFLNPSIQGWSKLWRTATGRKTARQWTHLIVKALAVGISVGLLNDLLNGDDEDYENLNQRDKDNNYILRIGEGRFLKLPKGRVVAALGTIASRTKASMQGDEKAWEGTVGTVMEMVSPYQNMTSTIFSAFQEAKTNTTWYGGQIESQSMQNLAVQERYDEGTSSIAIWIGKSFNVSPKKVHYVIDQYSGVIGDVILPLTSEKAERGMIVSAFTIDGVASNSLSMEFYDLKDSLMYAKNSGDINADILYSYMNKISGDISEMYKQKREIQADTSLKDKEKLEQTRILQATINATLQASMISVEEMEQILINLGYEESVASLLKNKGYAALSTEDKTKAAQRLKTYTYEMAMSNLTGLKAENTKYYLYDSIGASATAVYLTEINKIESDKDKNGKVIANSRKEKVHAYIQKLKITKEQKYILMYLAGYTPTAEGKQYVEKHLKNKGFSDEEVKKIWE